MPRHARSKVVRRGEPGIFHVTSRCARQYRLLGFDPLTGKDYSHRRAWMLDRLQLLVSCFGIDIGFGALMENHFHLVLRVMPEVIRRLSERQIAARWLRVCPGKRYLDGTVPEPTEEQIVALMKDKEQMAKYRQRLMDVSWFMRCFKEYVSHRANAEDNRSGHFWDSRFGCREVVGESALLVCGIYVDLNEIRAGAASGPEDSLWTTAGIRLTAARLRAEKSLLGPVAMGGLNEVLAGVGTAGEDGAAAAVREGDALEGLGGRVGRHGPAKAWIFGLGAAADAWFAPLTRGKDDLPFPRGEEPCHTKGRRASDRGLLSLTSAEYFTLLDLVGRREQPGKASIAADALPILERLGIDPSLFEEAVRDFPRLFPGAVGPPEALRERAEQLGRMTYKGVGAGARVFGKPKRE